METEGKEVNHNPTNSIKQIVEGGLNWHKVGAAVVSGLVQRIFVFGKSSSRRMETLIKPELFEWQWSQVNADRSPIVLGQQTEKGPLSIINLDINDDKAYLPKQLRSSAWGVARDRVGEAVVSLPSRLPMKIIFVDCSEDQMKGAIVGCGLASYVFSLKKTKNRSVFLDCIGKRLSEKAYKTARLKYESINLARHLVNLPGGDLNPDGYIKIIRQTVGKRASLYIKGPKELASEGYGLIYGVGKGASSGPYIAHIKYRGDKKSKKLTAFVGKGITFDTGGLDIKPAASMRLMKKDMGGSASVLGLANYIIKAESKVNCDFYLAIAENSISANSFRPGDVLISKKGLSVEIHNTDAEGRLALADAMYYAATQKDKPNQIIDIATLTGAVKYGLGAYLPAVFSNHSPLEEKLLKSARTVGEPLWALPLDSQLESALSSSVADMANANDGYGGAISAALFLEKFVEGLPWAHFDIYAWTDNSRGPLAERGGTGQMVQTLIDFLEG